MRGGGGRWGFPGLGGGLTTVREGEERKRGGGGRKRGREGREDSRKGGRAVEKEASSWALMTRTQQATWPVEAVPWALMTRTQQAT